MMKLNYLWEAFTWTKKDGNGGSGIINVVQGQLLGKCSQKPFVTTLTMNLIFWVIILSSDKQAQ